MGADANEIEVTRMTRPDGLLRRTAAPAAADCAILLSLLASGLRFTRDLPDLADITLWDEAGYLERGLAISRHAMPPVQYGPLYSLYYWFLSLFVSDPVQIQFLAYRQTAVLVPIAFYACMRLARIPIRAAWPLAAFSILSYANIHLNTRVGHAALVVLLLACGMAMRSAALATALRWLLAGALLASFIRPEDFLTVLLLAPVWLFAEARKLRRTPGWRGAWEPLAVMLGLSIPICLLGPPAFFSPGGREMLAFSQHFAIRWVGWTGSHQNPFFEYPAIISGAFGTVHSPLQALGANPLAFMHFLGDNILDFLKAGPKLFLLHFQLPQWAGGRTTRPWVGIAVLCAVAATAAREMRTSGWKPLRPARLLLLLAVLAPAAASSVLIFPTDYYFLPIGFIGAAGILSWITSGTRDSRPMIGVLIAGIALQLALTPSLADTEFARRQRPNLTVIDHLRALRPAGPVHILEFDGGYRVFLGPGASWVQPYGKSTGFDAFSAANTINMIVSGDYLIRESPEFRDDPEWQRFIRDPGSRGFAAHASGVPNREILVRSDHEPRSRQ